MAKRCQCRKSDLRTLRGTTIQVCLECDWADLQPGDDPLIGNRGPVPEFEPIPWPPRAEERNG